MAVGDLYRVTWKVSIHGNPGTFTTEHREVTGSTDPEKSGTAGLLAALDAANVSSMNSILASDCQFESYSVRQVFGVNGSPPQTALVTNSRGLRGGESLPLTKAMVIREVQEDADATSNGRIFFAGVSENDTTLNIISSTQYLGFVQVFFNALLELGVNDQGVDWLFEAVVISSQTNVSPPPSYKIVSFEPNNVLFSARRRRTREPGLVDASDT